MPTFVCVKDCESDLFQIFITGMQSFAHMNDCKSFKQIWNNSGVPPFICANDCKSFLKNPKQFWCATLCMCEWLQVIFVADFDFWGAIVCMCEQLQVIIFDFIFWCANIRMCQVKSYFYFYFWCAIVRIYEQLQIMFWFYFYILACHRSYVQMIASCNLFWILFSGVQSFVCVNDCKSYFLFFIWRAIICMCGWLQFMSYFDFIFCVNYHWLKGLRAWIDGHGLIHHTKTL